MRLLLVNLLTCRKCTVELFTVVTVASFVDIFVNNIFDRK